MGLLDVLCVFDWITPALSLARDARGSHIIAVCSWDSLCALRTAGIPYGNAMVKGDQWTVDIPKRYEAKVKEVLKCQS